MSEWITDRRPCGTDSIFVYNAKGRIVHRSEIGDGVPWKPIPTCEPYVKPRRWTVRYCMIYHCWELYNGEHPIMSLRGLDRNNDEHLEAAERIADIYEEVMP